MASSSFDTTPTRAADTDEEEARMSSDDYYSSVDSTRPIPLPNSVLRRMIREGVSMARDKADTSSSSDTDNEAPDEDGDEEKKDQIVYRLSGIPVSPPRYNCSSSSDEDDNDLFPYDATPAGMVRCNYCLSMKYVYKMASPQLTLQTLQSLAQTLNDARKKYTRVVRYGHFNMRMINLVDPRSEIPCHFRSSRRVRLANKDKRYRVLAEYNLCEVCVSVIERKIDSYDKQFGKPPSIKEPDPDF